MASFELDDYPNEKIVFVKFLDDNDPRLLLLVTYNQELDTTYMKVLKIEKAKIQHDSDPNHDQRKIDNHGPSDQDVIGSDGEIG